MAATEVIDKSIMLLYYYRQTKDRTKLLEAVHLLEKLSAVKYDARIKKCKGDDSYECC